MENANMTLADFEKLRAKYVEVEIRCQKELLTSARQFMNDTEREREELVKELTSYYAMMAPHQQARMGGKLIKRSLQLLRQIRVPEMLEQAHKEKLLVSDIAHNDILSAETDKTA